MEFKCEVFVGYLVVIMKGVVGNRGSELKEMFGVCDRDCMFFKV